MFLYYCNIQILKIRYNKKHPTSDISFYLLIKKSGLVLIATSKFVKFHRQNCLVSQRTDAFSQVRSFQLNPVQKPSANNERERWCRGISHELSRHNWSSYWPEEAFEVAGTRRRVNGSKRRRERRKERNPDVISCLRCVVAGVRYIGPNDRPLRAAMRYPHAPHRERPFFFYFPSAKFSLPLPITRASNSLPRL